MRHLSRLVATSRVSTSARAERAILAEDEASRTRRDTSRTAILSPELEHVIVSTVIVCAVVDDALLIHGGAPFGSLLGVFDSEEEIIWGLAFLGIVLGVYFIPTAVAFSRDARSTWLVAVINTLFGWTLVGWVVALAVAIRSTPRAEEPKPIS
jgi:hypothetical protein